MLQPTMNRLVPQIAEAQKDGGLPAGDPILFYYMSHRLHVRALVLRSEMRATSGLNVTDPAVDGVLLAARGRHHFRTLKPKQTRTRTVLSSIVGRVYGGRSLILRNAA